MSSGSSKYILKADDNCCDADKVNLVESWTYDPGDTDGTVSVVENTVYGGQVKDYLYVEGSNLIDDNGNIKGDLEITFKCINPCAVAEGLGVVDSRINCVQVAGIATTPGSEDIPSFGGGSCVNGTGGQNVSLKTNAIAVGESIDVQVLGGMGPTRWAFSTNSNVIRASGNGVEVNNYRPEMWAFGPTQVENGDFIVDNALGSGGHIFTITAKKAGTAMIIFRDEADCSWQIGFQVLDNLCKKTHSQNGNQAGSKDGSLPKLGNDNDLRGDDSGLKHGKTDFCDCDPDTVTADTATPQSLYLMLSGLKSYGNGIQTPSYVYSGTKFKPGMRFLDLELVYGGINNSPYYISQILDIYVGENENIERPGLPGQTFRYKLMDDSGPEAGAGHGWDQDKGGPHFGSQRPKNIVNVSSSGRVTCKACTNNLPVIIHGYVSSENIIVPPWPEDKVEVNGGGSGTNVLQTRLYNGNLSKVTSITPQPQDEVRWTGLNYFVAVRCWCPKLKADFPEMDLGIAIKEDEEFSVNMTAVNGDIQPKYDVFFWDEDSCGMGKFPKGGPITRPEFDDLPPQNGQDGEFKIEQIDRDGVPKFVPIYSEAQLFYSHASSKATPTNKIPQMLNNQSKNYVDEDTFWENIDENSHEKPKHTPSENPYEQYKKAGLGHQPRGTFCLSYHKGIKFEIGTATPLPVVKKNGKPILLADKDNNEIVIPGKQNPQHGLGPNDVGQFLNS